MQKIFLILSLFILTGCGSDSTPLEKQQAKFKIRNTTFSVEIPKDWSSIPLKYPDEVFVAGHGDTNFIILQKNGYQQNMKDVIINDLKNNLFSFSLLAQSENQWQFLGKLSARTSRREFFQKIIPITGTTQYLWGSCSADYFEGLDSECSSILEHWKVVN